MLNKVEIRRQCLQNRHNLSSQERLHKSQSISNHLIQYLSTLQFSNVALYYPEKAEVDILPIISWCKKQQKQLLLPSVEKKNCPMQFHLWDGNEALVKNPYLPFREPKKQQQQAGVVPEVVVLPVVGFDSSGNRLGMGGGYYDRTLSLYAHNGHAPHKIGVAFSCQEVEQVPIEAYDHTLDAIATEDGLKQFVE